jgi:hypothetical protein
MARPARVLTGINGGQALFGLERCVIRSLMLG